MTAKNKAYGKIGKAVYKGPRRGYDFTKYVSIHQSSYNDIVEASPDEAIPESKRVLLKPQGHKTLMGHTTLGLKATESRVKPVRAIAQPLQTSTVGGGNGMPVYIIGIAV